MYFDNCGGQGDPASVFEYFNDFTSGAGIMDYRSGGFSIEVYNGVSVIRKETNCDPDGAFIPLGFNIDDYILVTRETRPNDGTSRNNCAASVS